MGLGSLQQASRKHISSDAHMKFDSAKQKDAETYGGFNVVTNLDILPVTTEWMNFLLRRRKGMEPPHPLLLLHLHSVRRRKFDEYLK